MATTSGQPSSVIEPGSVGRDDHWNEREFTGRSLMPRFGVAFRLLGALLAITLFAIATSVIALYTFDKYGAGFNRIASSNLPALVAASNLAQRSQELAANAPNLAVADGHFARRALIEGLRGQLQRIAESGEQVKTLAPATEGLNSLLRNPDLRGCPERYSHSKRLLRQARRRIYPSVHDHPPVVRSGCVRRILLCKSFDNPAT